MANSFLQEKIKALKGRKSRHKQNSVDQNGEEMIEVDPLTEKPTAAWEKLREFHTVHQLPPDMYLQGPRQYDTLRFVCLSDTHGAVEKKRREFHQRVPDGDVLIHCGDFTMVGDPSEIIRFDSFIGHLPHPVKLVIAGNHELTFEDVSYGVHPVLVRQQLGLSPKAPPQEVVAGCKALLQHLLYLEDEAISICGIKIYGSPWVPTFGTWGFSVRRGENLLQKWNKIPSDTDILITHGPPCGYGDDVGNGRKKAGCVELLSTVVKRVKPKFHVFGHIHDGRGMWTNGTTTFINAAVCSNKYKPNYDPIVFDIQLPRGYSREDFAHLSTESLRQARNTTTKSHEEQNGCVSGVADDFDTGRKPMEKSRDEASTEPRSSDVGNNPMERLSGIEDAGAAGCENGVLKDSSTRVNSTERSNKEENEHRELHKELITKLNRLSTSPTF